MKLPIAFALVFLLGTAASQEPEKEVPAAPRKSQFVLDPQLLDESRVPLRFTTSDFDLWERATKVTSEPPDSPPGVGFSAPPVAAYLKVSLPQGQKGSGFEFIIYPRSPDQDSGTMGIYRVTAMSDHVNEERFLGWFHDKELWKLCEAAAERWLDVRASRNPLRAYSTISRKAGAPGVWEEKLHVVNVSGQPLQIESVTIRVQKAGTTEELRKAVVTWPPKMKRLDGKRQIELLPQRSWLALSTEWDQVPDLGSQTCWAWVGSSETGKSWRVEVSRSIEAEVDKAGE